MKLEIGSRSDKGRVRESNEDSMGVYRPADAQERARKGELFLVADGMGGHASGQVASRMAVDIILRAFGEWTGDDVEAGLMAAVQQANAEIHAYSGEQEGLARMGTTCVGAWVRGSELRVINVGDSRAYRVRRGRIDQLSRDHSLVAMEVEKGLIGAEQARHMAYRSTITRALGPKPVVEVDHFQHTLQVGDVIVLCTDGLSGQVQDAEIAAAVSSYLPDQAAARLVDWANERGGPDNISVMVVRVVPDIPSAPAATPVSRAVMEPAWKKYIHFWPFALVALAALLFVALVAFAVFSAMSRATAPTMAPKTAAPGIPAPGTRTPTPGAPSPVLIPTAPQIGPLKIDVTSNLVQLEELAKQLGYNTALQMEAQNPRQGKLLTVSPRRKALLVVGYAGEVKFMGQTCELKVTMGDSSYRATCPPGGVFDASVRLSEGTPVSMLGINEPGTELRAIMIDARQSQWMGLVKDWVNWYKDPDADRSLWVYTVSGPDTIGDGTREGIQNSDPVLVYAVWEADRTKISKLVHLGKWNGNHYTLVY